MPTRRSSNFVCFAVAAGRSYQKDAPNGQPECQTDEMLGAYDRGEFARLNKDGEYANCHGPYCFAASRKHPTK